MNTFDSQMQEINSKYQFNRLIAIKELTEQLSKAIFEIGESYEKQVDKYDSIADDWAAEVSEIETDEIDYKSSYCNMVYAANDYAISRAARLEALEVSCYNKEAELRKMAVYFGDMLNDLQDYINRFELAEKPALMQNERR